MIAVLRDSEDWWWVECPCGYREGPFDGQEYALDDAHEHDCCPDGAYPQESADICTPENVETQTVTDRTVRGGA